MGVHGSIDVLVNNAGVGAPMPAETEPPDTFRQVMDVNVNGLLVLAQLVGRHMIERGRGSIVNVASILGVVASAPIKQASYTATKGAVVNLTRELACQWARKGVRVNAIAPGWIVTEINREFLAGEGAGKTKQIPAGRFGEECDLDGAFLLLASNAGRYMAGSVIVVDGGQMLALAG
jgi:NAD(P)-dependent dehydrogenase (short-subunit alcohol dehydrogenase family)